MIVLGVPDPDRLVRSKAELAQRVVHPGRLVDAGGEHHDGRPVEDHVQLQSRLLDRLEYRGVVRQPGRDNNPPDIERNAQRLQALDELQGGRIGQQCLPSGARLVDDGPVFCHDVIEQVDVGKDREEVLQPSAGDEDRATAGHAKALDRRDRGISHLAVDGDRAVIVGDESQVSHHFVSRRIHSPGRLTLRTSSAGTHPAEKAPLSRKRPRAEGHRPPGRRTLPHSHR